MAYEEFQQIFGSDRFKKLRQKGARVQRPLWASTSTKNPNYRDVLYIEELIGPDTVNTMPPQTLEAFRDHGQVAPTLHSGWAQAHADIAALTTLGIDLEKHLAQLQEDVLFVTTSAAR